MQKSVISKRDLLINLVKANFKMRYQNSVLGILWVLIKPYATFLVLYYIRVNAGKAPIENYGLYLLIGIVFYGFISEMITFGQMALLDKSNIILKVSFPKEIALLSSLANAVINLLINTLLILILALTAGVHITPLGIMYFILVSITAFIWGLGISFFTSVFTIRFRDLKNIMELALFLFYWATPIFFVAEKDSLAGGSSFMALNPVGILINQVRAGFNIYSSIEYSTILIYLAVGLIVCYLGSKFFNRQVKKIAEYF